MSISTLTYFPLIEEVELDDEKTLQNHHRWPKSRISRNEVIASDRVKRWLLVSSLPLLSPGCDHARMTATNISRESEDTAI